MRRADPEAERGTRRMELKFLGSGLTTAAAKKKFAAARKVVKDVPPVGRAGARAAGMDARLANANKYLTQRAKRAVPGKLTPAEMADALRSKKWSAFEGVPTAELRKFVKRENLADLRPRATRAEIMDIIKAGGEGRALAGASHARNPYRRSVMDNTDAFSAKRKKVTGMAVKPDVPALAERLKTADAAGLNAMSRDLSGLSREDLVDVANRAGFSTPKSATKKAVLDRINRRAADRTWWANRTPNPSAA